MQQHVNLKGCKLKLKTAILTAVLACSSAYAPFASAGFLDAFDSSKQKLTAYQASEDKALVDHFYYLSEDGKQEGVNKDIDTSKDAFKLKQASPASLTFSRPLYRGDRLGDIGGEMREYADSPLNDVFGRRYVAFASSRGNTVKMYKPALGKIINGMYKQYFEFSPAPNVADWIGIDNPLIEYSPGGAIVSVMTRSHQAIYNFTARSYQYINIYFGANSAQFLENKIANHFYTDNFLRVVSSSSADVATPAQASPVAPSLIVGVAATPEQRIQMLKALGDLKKSGVLSAEEFSVEKAKILAE